jgi:hypothetical protein
MGTGRWYRKHGHRVDAVSRGQQDQFFCFITRANCGLLGKHSMSPARAPADGVFEMLLQMLESSSISLYSIGLKQFTPD